MKTEEINKVLAEFMGKKELSQTLKNMGAKDYTDSLDSLVPIWEKLKEVYDVSLNVMGSSCTMGIMGRGYTDDIQAKTIQEAAALATAKCVMELQK